MTLREGCTPTQLLAHKVLDQVAQGLPMPVERVLWALIMLGDVE